MCVTGRTSLCCGATASYAPSTTLTSNPLFQQSTHTGDAALLSALTVDRASDRCDISHSALPDRVRANARLGVLDVTEWYGDTSGGIRTYLLQKARYVSTRTSLRHVMLVPGEFDSITSCDGVRMYRLQGPPIPRKKPYRFMLATRSIDRVIRHERPDVIEVGSPFMVPWIVAGVASRMNIPMIGFYHSNVPRLFKPRDGKSGLLRRGLYRSAWEYMRRLDQLFPLTIVTSDYSVRELENEGITRIARVPLGVDLEQFHPALRSRRDYTRREFGLPSAPLAGYVGRFAGEKELHLLLDGWREVERRTGARLVLVGAGPIELELRTHRYGNRVSFVPFQGDRQSLARLLACFDLYVAPGSIETFGLSSLEALASGTPVLTSNKGGVADLVRKSCAGREFESGDADSLAEAAIALFNEDLTALGQLGREFAEREHSWQSVFDRLFQVYERVVTSQ